MLVLAIVDGNILITMQKTSVTVKTKISFRTLSAIWLVVGCLYLSACTPIGVWLESRDRDVVIQVAQLPPGYDSQQPQQPYSGPHPSRLPFNTEHLPVSVGLGEIGPIDDSLGPAQYPFACATEASGLGQPLLDNQAGIGTPVFLNGDVIGYSKDCLIETQAAYFYKPLSTTRLTPLLPDTDPTLIDSATVNGETVPFVVRLERGTINRFIYSIAVLADPSDSLARPSAKLWNGKLIYFFRGGVGIGKRQGDVRVTTGTRDRIPQLAEGYAVAYSSGNATSVHYNIELAAHTAAMVKHQFVGLYGEPDYTVGLGGSGGAIQQLLLAQNQPGLLDALIPQYSFPDMVTQTIWAYDCELLEYYFDITARQNKRWRKKEQRTLIEGLAANSDAANPFNDLDFWSRLAGLHLPRLSQGATECALAWRALTPLTNNPTYTHHSYRYAPDLFNSGRWSYWHDLRHIYGVDADGYAFRPYDNVGVQYGLVALRTGAITPAEFLHLNANIGTWKPAKQLRPERYWLLSGSGSLAQVRLWSDHNMLKTPDSPIPLAAFTAQPTASTVRVAPRTTGHIGAIQAAYRSGQVFLGNVDLPIIDVRHYLDDQLDMHHSFASIATRLRLQRSNGHHKNHLIWVAAPPFDPTPLALQMIDEWLQNGRPSTAEDACWNSQGTQIARGQDVWDGAWNGRPAGTCMQDFPTYQSPRDAAGGPLTGDIFKCHLQSIEDAIQAGEYGDIDMLPYNNWLEIIFADGVCNYAMADMGLPDDLLVRIDGQ